LNPPEWAGGNLPPEAPVFQEPWQAQAFALVVALHERGVFTWPEWTQALAAAIHADVHDDGDAYYHCWLAALESLVKERDLVAAPDLLRGKNPGAALRMRRHMARRSCWRMIRGRAEAGRTYFRNFSIR
jgi:nitrile hydratase accessory protein